MAREGQIRLGGLWKKTPRSGGSAFYAGPIGPNEIQALRDFIDANPDGAEITLFQNRDKRTEKSPDVSLLLAPPYQPENGSGGGSSYGGADGGAPPPVDDDDVPF